MKTFHPGTIYKVNDVIVRAKKSSSCEGCIFDNMFSCPKVKDKRQRGYTDNEILCYEKSIIFVKP